MLGSLCHLSYPSTKNSGNKWKNHFFQNEGGYRDGLELQQGKKQGVVTQQNHTELHDTIPISLSIIST